jgi:hypothetical protein
MYLNKISVKARNLHTAENQREGRLSLPLTLMLCPVAVLCQSVGQSERRWNEMVTSGWKRGRICVTLEYATGMEFSAHLFTHSTNSTVPVTWCRVAIALTMSSNLLV